MVEIGRCLVRLSDLLPYLTSQDYSYNSFVLFNPRSYKVGTNSQESDLTNKFVYDVIPVNRSTLFKSLDGLAYINEGYSDDGKIEGDIIDFNNNTNFLLEPIRLNDPSNIHQHFPSSLSQGDHDEAFAYRLARMQSPIQRVGS